MDIVIKAKHWQVFGTLIGLVVIRKLLMIVSISWASGMIGVILYLLEIVVTLGWALVLGSILHKQNKTIQKRDYTLFLVTGITLILVVCLLPFLMPREVMETHSIVMILYFIYALISLFIVFSFPARTLKALELKEKIDINDYFGDIFLFLFWPIGIWFIQPRLNKIAQAKMADRQGE